MSIYKEIERLESKIATERTKGIEPNIEALASQFLSKDALEYWFMVRYWIALR